MKIKESVISEEKIEYILKSEEKSEYKKEDKKEIHIIIEKPEEKSKNEVK
jgi:hypothetical protein